ncbi:DUF1738 domain-containing protein [Bradyrhizobium sp. WSM 1704]|uniref:ArdC family protein n=1 Tax=Bradyrhizobium semiaridum TaxID=2821404 RepID=UPI001CE23A66|nr:zincin-like metallopeptidase domain-containing protein [Bradyrhizobium semiaridum]MCA6121276.1 DUF1738 domain-containing protein [Bradyrhizobium semiaridum]
MTRKTQAPQQRQSIYEEITTKIIAELEAGIFPWARPWDASPAKAAFSLPSNAATGKNYSGINILILWGRLYEGGFSMQRWLTYRQAQSLGAKIRKGEHGVAVCYADRFIPRREEAAKRPAASDAGEQALDEAAIPFLRRYVVFNVDQCEDLPEQLIAAAPALPEREIVPEAERLANATGAVIRVGGTSAFYDPASDSVHIPPQPAFFEQINYYRTLFHELGHWTGHTKRLDRDQSGAFGSKAYAREELVAELTTAFVCASLRIRPTVRHADYLGSWLAVLREDNRAIFRAASKASRAADLLLAFGASKADAQAGGASCA